MKKLLSITAIILIVYSCRTNAQTLNRDKLIQIIDSLQSIIDENNWEISTLKTSNLEIENELKKYNSQLNEIHLENQKGEVLFCMTGTLLYTEPGGYKSLCKINRGDRVKVIVALEKHYKVYFNEMTGYVLKSGFKSESELLSSQKKKSEIAAQKKAADEEKVRQAKLAEENRLNTLIIAYGKTDGTKIWGGQIWIGMTDTMAYLSKGTPNDINKSVGSWGTNEQWVYGGGLYLYFENGILTSWQE